MPEALAYVTVVLLVAAVSLLIVLWRRSGGPDPSAMTALASSVDKGQERTERAVREEIGKNREESAGRDRDLRQEVGATLKGGIDSVVKTLGEMSGVQRNQLGEFSGQLGKVGEASQAAGRQLREEVTAGLKGFNDSVLKQMADIAVLQREQLEGFSTRLAGLSQSNEQKLEALRQTIENRLKLLQEDNTQKLEAMRVTVDEKLQGTLERRLAESFKLVSERLEQVHKGLGEMQTLASGVGDLKRVLTNVKTRGTWGEVQLGNLLEQVLSPEQYAANVATKEGSDERVEFAIKLPGHDETEGQVVWLPIDAKFPKEDYEQLVEAADRADGPAVETAGKQLEARIKACARDIRDKYLSPPRTTDFGVMFLPSEGLYAEVLRRPGVVEQLQREFRVNVAGPTTLAALLNSLQMGFRTLAIQKRSSEVWDLLAAIKTEFGRFGEVLAKVQKKLQEATNVMDQAAVRTRAIERKLLQVQQPHAGETPLLPDMPGRLADQNEDEPAG